MDSSHMTFSYVTYTFPRLNRARQVWDILGKEPQKVEAEVKRTWQIQTVKAFLFDLSQNWHYSYSRIATEVTQREERWKVTDHILP